MTSFLPSLQSPLYLSRIFDKHLVTVKEGAFKYPASTSGHDSPIRAFVFTKLNTMPAPSQLLRAARPAFRSQFFTSKLQSSRTGFKSKFGGRRWQSTASPAAQPSWFKRMWDSPIGLKTVHFWFVPFFCPANLSDWCAHSIKLTEIVSQGPSHEGTQYTLWPIYIVL